MSVEGYAHRCGRVRFRLDTSACRTYNACFITHTPAPLLSSIPAERFFIQSRRGGMNKRDIVEKIAREAGITKTTARRRCSR